MTHLLPPNLLRLFAPRPPLEYAIPLRQDPDPNAVPLPKDPTEISTRKRPRVPLTGVVHVLERIKQEAADSGQVTEENDTVPLTHTLITLSELASEEKQRIAAETKKAGLEAYDPNKDPNVTSDAYKTLFLGRLAYSTTEKDLRREFEIYGPINKVRIVTDIDGKPRGYAFLMFERERDMKAAYKDAEGVKINGRRTLVDVERGRTVKDWKPMRLGGGLGGNSRKPKKTPEPVETSTGPGFVSAPSRGFRGPPAGFRGRGGPPRPNPGPPRRTYEAPRYGPPPSQSRPVSFGNQPTQRSYPDSRNYPPPQTYNDGPPNKRSRY